MTFIDRTSLYNIAQSVGIKVPYEISESTWDLFPHFELFCAMQSYSEVPNEKACIDNAKLISRLAEDDVHMVSKNKLLKMGFIVGQSDIIDNEQKV